MLEANDSEVLILSVDVEQCRASDGSRWADSDLWTHSGATYDAGHRASVPEGLHLTTSKRGKLGYTDCQMSGNILY